MKVWATNQRIVRINEDAPLLHSAAMSAEEMAMWLRSVPIDCDARIAHRLWSDLTNVRTPEKGGEGEKSGDQDTLMVKTDGAPLTRRIGGIPHMGVVGTTMGAPQGREMTGGERILETGGERILQTGGERTSQKTGGEKILQTTGRRTLRAGGEMKIGRETIGGIAEISATVPGDLPTTGKEVRGDLIQTMVTAHGDTVRIDGTNLQEEMSHGTGTEISAEARAQEEVTGMRIRTAHLAIVDRLVQVAHL